MNKLAIALTVVAASTVLAACKKSDDNGSHLPPATGTGAPPLPEIPDVRDPAGGTAAPDPSGAGASVFAGTLEATTQVEVAAKASGTLVALNVDDGSKVKKGEVLFRLDSRDAQLRRKQGVNSLASAKLALRTAQREYDRIAGLVAQNAVPAIQLDQLRDGVESAKLMISQAETGIAMADKAIADATVRSPLTGVVIAKVKNVGEYVTLMPPTPVVILQDQSALELKFHLPERALASLHQGDPVTVRIPSQSINRAAKIAQISPMVNPRTRTVEVTALIDNCDGGLRPGIAAEVELGAPDPATVKAPACAQVAAGQGR